MGKFKAASRPWERISLDLSGPYRFSSEGNTYLLVIVDAFTRYCLALPLPDGRAETVAKHFVEHCILRFGQPSAVLSDCGKNLTSKIFSECCKLLGIERLLATPFCAFQDGQAERHIGSVKRCLTALVDGNATDWDTWAHFAAHALNTTKSRATQHSPHYLLFGFEPTTGLDFLEARVPRPYAEDYPLQLKFRMSSAYQAVRKYMDKEVNHRLAKYNATRQAKNFACGDLVYYKRRMAPHAANAGLLPKWIGPVEVLRKIGNLSYIVGTHGGRSYRAHARQLKRHFSREVEPGAVGTDPVVQTPDKLPSPARNNPVQTSEPTFAMQPPKRNKTHAMVLRSH